MTLHTGASSATVREEGPTTVSTTILINAFEVPPDVDDERFLAGWDQAAAYLSGQPGFVASRLHRAIGPDARFRFVNVAEWASPNAFRAAVSSDAFRRMAGSGMPPNYPALYDIVRTVAGTAGGGKEPRS